MFLNLPPAEARLLPVTESSFPSSSSWMAVQRRITRCNLNNPFYKISSARVGSCILGILIILGGICLWIASLIHSSSFSCSKMLATVIGSLTLLSGGIAVLHRIACKTDVLYGEKIQPFMSRRWEQVKVCDKLGESIQLDRKSVV